MSEWSAEALAFFKARAIDPAVAHEAGVRQNGSGLIYPHGRTRAYSGHSMQPNGVKPRGWWVRPQTNGSHAVLICEGETDGLAAASALASSPEAPGFRDLPVLAIPGIQAIPPDSIARRLADLGISEAYIAYDADERSRPVAQRLADALARVRVKPLRAEPPTSDIADWLCSVEAPGEALASHLADAQPYEVGPPSLASVADAEVEWIWRNRIPRGRLSCIAGVAGEGKSLWTVALASELSRQGKTIFMANDDDDAEDIKHRVVAAKGDLRRFRLVSDIVLPSIKGLEEFAAYDSPDLVTIDPYHHFLADRINPMRVHEMKVGLDQAGAVEAVGDGRLAGTMGALDVLQVGVLPRGVALADLHPQD